MALEHRKSPSCPVDSPEAMTIVVRALGVLDPLIPESVNTYVKTMRHQTGPLAYRHSSAGAILKAHVTYLEKLIDILGLSNQAAAPGSPADINAKASAESRKVQAAADSLKEFKALLDDAPELSVLDDFQPSTVSPSRPGLRDQTSLVPTKPEPDTIDLDALDLMPSPAREEARAQEEVGGGS